MVSELASQISIAKGVRRKLKADAGYSEGRAAIDFGADIELLAARVPHRRLVLLLDEIEHVTFDISPADHWQDDFLSMWSTLRSVHQNSRGRFTYVIAGVNPYAAETHRIHNHDNPLFSTLQSFFVWPLSRSHTAQMIRSLSRMMGLSVDVALIDGMFADFGGHPFLTRRACSQLASTLPDRPAVMTGDLWLESRAGINHALVPNAKQILTVLETWYPYEYELLQALASGDESTSREYAKSSSEFCSHVVGYGLVRDPQTRPQFTVGLVKDVLQQMALESPLDDMTVTSTRLQTTSPDELDEVWDEIRGEISVRRNRLERDLRRRAEFALEAKYGRKARERVLEALATKRQQEMAHESYESLWRELYWAELGAIMVANWSLFENWARMTSDDFQLRVTTINQGRLDAHERTTSEDELGYLRVCFRKLEERCGLAT